MGAGRKLAAAAIIVPLIACSYFGKIAPQCEAAQKAYTNASLAAYRSADYGERKKPAPVAHRNAAKAVPVREGRAQRVDGLSVKIAGFILYGRGNGKPELIADAKISDGKGRSEKVELWRHCGAAVPKANPKYVVELSGGDAGKGTAVLRISKY